MKKFLLSALALTLYSNISHGTPATEKPEDSINAKYSLLLWTNPGPKVGWESVERALLETGKTGYAFVDQAQDAQPLPQRKKARIEKQCQHLSEYLYDFLDKDSLENLFSTCKTLRDGIQLYACRVGALSWIKRLMDNRPQSHASANGGCIDVNFEVTKGRVRNWYRVEDIANTKGALTRDLSQAMAGFSRIQVLGWRKRDDELYWNKSVSITKALRGLSNLQDLTLNGCLDDSNADVVAQALHKLTNLKDLDIIHNSRLDAVGMSHILKAISYLKKLERLELMGNGIFEDGLTRDRGSQRSTVLAPHMGWISNLPHLKRLIIDGSTQSYTKHVDDHALVLAEHLPTLPSLEVFVFRYHNIYDRSARALLDALRSCPKLKSISIIPYYPFGNSIVEALVELIENNTSIQSLEVPIGKPYETVGMGIRNSLRERFPSLTIK